MTPTAQTPLLQDRERYNTVLLCIPSISLETLMDMDVGYKIRSEGQEETRYLNQGRTVTMDRDLELCEIIVRIACVLFCCTCGLMCNCCYGFPTVCKRVVKKQCCSVQIEAFVCDEQAGKALRRQDYEHWGILQGRGPYARRNLREFAQNRLDVVLHPSQNQEVSYMVLTGPVSGFTYILLIPQDPTNSFCPLFPCCDPFGNPYDNDASLDLIQYAERLCKEYQSNMQMNRKIQETLFRTVPTNVKIPADTRTLSLYLDRTSSCASIQAQPNENEEDL